MILLYSPFPNLESARAAAQALLEARLVACCNLLTGVESHYRWEGALTMATETILLAKTTVELADDATQRLAALHPYETPAILRLDAAANPAFAQWVSAETSHSA